MIPFIDLTQQYDELKSEIEPALLSVCRRGQYVMGREVADFEEKIAAYLNVKYAVSCGNGTDALTMLLDAMEIGEGDEVITTPFTFFSTAEAIARVGATPVFADIDEGTFNLDPSKAEAAVSQRTKAILPVHLFGNPANITAINQLAQKHSLKVTEDACQAVGARFHGQSIGSLGDCAAFSFFPTKNLGCFGDGGLMTTNDTQLAARLRSLRVHGSSGNQKYVNERLGYNSRLDTLQAAILQIKLPHLDGWNQRRRELAAYYTEKLSGLGLVPQSMTDQAESVYHLYAVKAEERDETIKRLKERGIASGIYYPIPLHLQKAFAHLGYQKGDFPVAEGLAENILALPLFPEMTTAQQDQVIACLKG